MKQVKPSFIGAKTLCALALMGAFSAQAQAQSSVTIYGRVVAGVDIMTNVPKNDGSGTTGTRIRSASNQWGTSMIGFKGTEDLGGGTNAFFLLESGFGSTTGGLNGTDVNGTSLFNRRSYVGLSSANAGTLKLGKNLFINNDVWFLDPTGQQWIGTANLVRGRNWPGASNVIEYTTPTYGGFGATLQTSLGEAAGSFSKGGTSTKYGRKDGLSLVYQNNGLELRGIYDVVRDPNGRYTDVYDTSKELILGGTYKIDKLKLFLGYENLRAPDVNPASGAPDRVNHYWLGANYDVTSQLQLVGSVFHVNANNGNGSANLFMAGVNYFLSKRTLLYVGAGTMRNGNNANYSLEADSSTGGGKGTNQTGGYFGIAHSF
ncbi:putative porin [Herbaspirillum rubrisubalbicans]|uniref:Porin n=1 Tax=Herbaspirillum rubrisubalbicans Os34 TaxID=1235827 RepID=A0A6M3ZM07_9BURK|nr:porin [Herbaspirillum rubrisubalbicans]MCP1576308.1 putative porin [Herbaspirillum rubrisubalbicans]QJP99555.1 porin [Herbaspirillum rubrisubalbicans Os34]